MPPKGYGVRVLVWSERTEPEQHYPNGINGAIASFLNSQGMEARASSLNDPGQGLNLELLNYVDVLVWWGHSKHGEVDDDNVENIVKRVRENGMGFIALHSAHFSKPFKTLLGTDCSLGSWREDGLPELIHVFNKKHPIARGIKDFILKSEEMYGEPFAVPKPQDMVFISIFEADGAIFRSGLTWRIGKGRVFYFRPGHETYPTFRNRNVLKILKNAVLWAAGRL
ncbi:MAG: ThuA domain-containing protein [Thermoproteota archaeon]